MAINLVTKFEPYVDEVFTTESKKSILTNADFSWTGAHTIKVYKVSTAPMTDYDRAGTGTAQKESVLAGAGMGQKRCESANDEAKGETGAF